jgi:hypothetical protein
MSMGELGNLTQTKFDPIAAADAIDIHAEAVGSCIKKRIPIPPKLIGESVGALRAAQQWLDAQEELAKPEMSDIRDLPERRYVLKADKTLSSISDYELLFVLRCTSAGLRQLHKLRELRPNRGNQ